jgi:hypothetical protein
MSRGERESDLCKGEIKIIGEARTFGVGRVGQVIRRKQLDRPPTNQGWLCMHGNNPRESRHKMSQIWWELLAASALQHGTGDPLSFLLWSGRYSVSRRTYAAEESRPGSFALTHLMQASSLPGGVQAATWQPAWTQATINNNTYICKLWLCFLRGCVFKTWSCDVVCRAT